MAKQQCRGIASSQTHHPTGVDPLLLSVNGAAAALGISRPSIYKLLASGKVSPVKLGGRTLVRMESLREYVDTLARYPMNANVVEEA